MLYAGVYLMPRKTTVIWESLPLLVETFALEQFIFFHLNDFAAQLVFGLYAGCSPNHTECTADIIIPLPSNWFRITPTLFLGGAV